MALIDEMRETLTRLANGGWTPLFQRLGIDPDAPNLREQLLQPIPNIGSIRSLAGFEELSRSAIRAIEPQKPAESILFYMLASPAVVGEADGHTFSAFPSAADIESAENLVFGIQTLSAADIRTQFSGFNLAICVFAREFRQRAGTVHSAHADMVFSRTGIVRVGTDAPHWDGHKRAFSAMEPGDDSFMFRTLPCRYGVYLAVQKFGDPADFGPFRADRTTKANQVFEFGSQTSKRDSSHEFWVPVHKLFSGTECLRGQDLRVSLSQSHVNEKLRRIHLSNMGAPAPFASGFKAPAINTAPFTVDTGLAEFLDETEFGTGTLNAIPRPRLIEPAVLNGTPIGVKVPERGGLAASFTIPALTDKPRTVNRTGAHRAPEWMHVRTQLRSNGTERDLNEVKDVEDMVESGRVGNADPYTARHYVDFTGDGWLAARIAGLQGHFARRIPAYSIIAAPDFYPYVSQSALLDWSMNEVPSRIRRRLWSRPPLSLCDQRVAPNLSLRRYGAPFVPEDETVSAILGLAESSRNAVPASSAPQIDRVTSLPDGAAGFYAPGWDTSIDYDDTDSAWHLAAHGLGSPFPEDAKLCAALSAFWPAAAPDTSRSWGGQNFRIIAPMTDSEIGLAGAPAWDGITGPRRVTINGKDHIENDDFSHVDYVKVALSNKFTMSETMKVDQATYQSRVLASHQMFMMLKQEFSSDNFRMLSFVPADASDIDFIATQTAAGPLAQPAHKFVMVQTGGRRPLARDPQDRSRWLVQTPINATITIFVGDDGDIVFSADGGAWRPFPAP